MKSRNLPLTWRRTLHRTTLHPDCFGTSDRPCRTFCNFLVFASLGNNHEGTIRKIPQRCPQNNQLGNQNTRCCFYHLHILRLQCMKIVVRCIRLTIWPLWITYDQMCMFCRLTARLQWYWHRCTFWQHTVYNQSICGRFLLGTNPVHILGALPCLFVGYKVLCRKTVL